MNETLLNKARLNVVSLNKALINGAVERHGSSAGGGGAPSKYIRFADPAVEAVLMANGVSSDGVGITKEDAAAVTSIGTWFKGNTDITSFDEFKYFTGVTVLHGANEKGAFAGCSSLKKITLPPYLTEIQNQSFRYCSALESINLSNIAKIGQEAFVSTSSLSIELNMPNLQSLGWSAFKKSGIKSIQNLGSITKLDGSNENGTFFQCLQLESAVLPETLTTISNQAFRGCSLLADINIPSSVTTISQEAFSGCSLLYFDELDLPNLTSLGQNAFYGVKIKKLSVPRLTSFPSGSTSSQNFGSRSNLEELEISESVTTIPMYFLHGYSKITSLNLKNITSIADYGLRGCYLTEAVLPNIVTLGAQPFREASSLTLVDIGSGLTSTSLSWAFMGCKQLSTLIIRVITPPSIDTYTFNGTKIASGTGIIYVPDAALEVYKTATNWSAYADRIHPLSELEGSPYITFADPEVERVLMENNVSSDGVGITMADAEAVTSIGSLFKGNTVITSFNEFEYFTGVTFLGTSTNQTSGGAFNGCTSLASIKIPSSVTVLRPGAFYNCTSLRNVGDLSNVKQIGIYAFSGTLLEGEINLASVDGEIGYRSFAKTNITKILSLGNATIIGGSTQSTTGAFAECGLLQSVELPSTLTEIQNWAFYKCASLEIVICRATTPPTLAFANAFSNTNNCSIYVPDSAVDDYKAATNWSTYASKIKPLSEYVE